MEDGYFEPIPQEDKGINVRSCERDLSCGCLTFMKTEQHIQQSDTSQKAHLAKPT